MNTLCEKAFELSCLLNSANVTELTQIVSYYCTQAGEEEIDRLSLYANELRLKYYGKKVYFRGLIEFSNYCRNDCYYCGIRKSNKCVYRYRLSKREIIECCRKGYDLGFRTFVLQSGEDPYYTDSRMCDIIDKIKSRFSDCAVTLSIGERSYASYKLLYKAGADRYLLRHETAAEKHYGLLHPFEQSLATRKRCLYNLKEIGYQIGAGFMVESPYQTFEYIAEDLVFLRELKPHMIGIGPFIPHKDTKFAAFKTPSSKRTLIMLSLIRIMLPKTLIPSTTAIATADPLGRIKGLRAGANVVMPNLSPITHRKDYSLYDNKICMGEEAAEYVQDLARRISSYGFDPDFSRGDYIDLQIKTAAEFENGGNRRTSDAF
jgi:biotin synthase